MDSITSLFGKRDVTGRQIVPSMIERDETARAYVDLQKRIVARGGDRFVRCLSKDDIATAISNRPGIMAKQVYGEDKVHISDRGRLTLQKGAKVDEIRIPFKEVVSREFDPPRMEIVSWIELKPGEVRQLDTPTAMWLLSHEHWSLIVDECVREGNPIELDTHTPPAQEPMRPGGR